MRACAVWRGEQIHGEIAEEREFHIAMYAADLVRVGMSEAAANEAARRKFGGALRMQEQSFDVRGGGVMEDIASDVRLALRVFLRPEAKQQGIYFKGFGWRTFRRMNLTALQAGMEK